MGNISGSHLGYLRRCLNGTPIGRFLSTVIISNLPRIRSTIVIGTRSRPVLLEINQALSLSSFLDPVRALIDGPRLMKDLLTLIKCLSNQLVH